ncbi:MAG: MBL fold metallo-hydrolase, partial [Oscillospiraceae bacterium]|nr:MBL fold metallo-hydrolase [Oscillospiraceae bacterium]
SPFSNLLTLWSVPGAFILGAAAGIFGAIWLPLGIPFAFAARLCVRYFAFVARITGGGALSSVHASSWPIRVWLAATYAAIVIALALKNRKKAVPIAALFSSALLSVSLLYINLCPLPLTMNVLDVGQGVCTVFLSRDTAVMVDCGGDDAGQKALSHMRSRGLESLDILVLTHLHKDHISGAKLLLSQIDVGCVIVPEGDEGIIRDIENSLGKNSELIRAADGVAISTGEVSLEIMQLRMPKNENDESLAVLCSSDGFNALITGDMTSSGERQLCARYSLPRCDVYVAGHHGDAASSGDELLSTIKPEIAVISCDEDNPYGHPDHETVQRLKKYGAAVLRTDIDGNISLPLERSDKNG